MSNILIFAGTSEGRELSEWLCKKKTAHDMCVATQYAKQVLIRDEFVNVHQGRMDETEMIDFIKENGTKTVIDATHPYAAEVTKNIKNAAEKTGTEYLRLDRNASEAASGKVCKEPEKYYFANSEQCADALLKTKGNILLTTGSKELALYTSKNELRDRITARVLPGSESIRICEECGIKGKQIIAMQGPFSVEMNTAIMREYDIKVIVTKLAGKAGGYFEKEQAAGMLNVPMYIIGMPGNSAGLSSDEVKLRLAKYIKKDIRRISLIGCGMGQRKNMTSEALEALDSSDIVFGAKRFLSNAGEHHRCYPYYLAKDIIPVLKETTADAAILFSGDTGFFSGASRLYEALFDRLNKGIDAQIRIYPGISSASNLSALTGISWDDAKIFSVHGKGEFKSWKGKLLHYVRTTGKTFLILSGVEDLNNIGRALTENGLSHCRIVCGYQMSYPEERVFYITPDEAINEKSEGLYALFILNDHAQAENASHGVTDSEFIRAKVPMTKEEVREVSISKLQLKRDSVVYDIGSGTGSVAVEIAKLSPDIKVYAIERKDEALELIRKNAEKFGLSNIEIISGYAPEAIQGLEKPTHAFIGGTGGRMKEILFSLFNKNREIRICANAVTIETFEELAGIEKEFSVEEYSLVSMSCARAKKAGSYNMMCAENPVWICSFKGK